MTLAELRFFSATLGMHTTLQALLPTNVEPPFATLYLLHGLSDNDTIWLRRTRLEVYAEKHNLAIILPNGYRGFYTNNNAGPAYADYITCDVTAACEKYFPLRTDRAGRCVGGLSMGGYGALRIALGWPDRYVSAHSHSGAVMYPQWGPGKESSMMQREHQQIFGNEPEGSPHDLIHLATGADRSVLPKLLIDCGRDDFLFSQNEAFHAALETAAVPHDYRLHDGAHTWEYWDLHIQAALAFHAAAVEAASAKPTSTKPTA